MRHVPHVVVAAPWPTATVPLDPATAHHLVAVLRRQHGSTLSYTDGDGTVGEGTLDLTGAPAVARGGERRVVVPRPHLTLAVAPPHQPARARFVVEKAAELGVGELIWVMSSATQGRPPSPAKTAAWSDGALEQSRGAHRMRIGTTVRPADLHEATIVADPDGSGVDAGWLDADVVTVLVGPEGGLRPDEIDRFPRRLGLGDTVLRTETAAVVAAAVLLDAVRRAAR